MLYLGILVMLYLGRVMMLYLDKVMMLYLGRVVMLCLGRVMMMYLGCSARDWERSGLLEENPQSGCTEICASLKGPL